jgi:hypothetical protein
MFISCQGEFEEEEIPDEQQFLVENSQLRLLLESITLHDGSFDNVVDQASCLSIIFPYTVSLDDVQFQIASQEDLDELEAIVGISGEDVDVLFPVTVRLSNHNLLTVSSEDMLEDLAEACVEDGEDPDIECVDLVYPVGMSYFDQANAATNNVSVTTDSALHRRLLELPLEDFLVSMIFPLEFTNSGGDILLATEANEAMGFISEFRDECDEMDEVEPDEIDSELPDSVLFNSLLATNWVVDSLVVSSEDVSSSFEGFEIVLQEDGNANLSAADQSFTGYWALSFELQYQLELYFDLDEEVDGNLIFINGSWILLESDEDRLVFEYADSEETDDSEEPEDNRQYLVLKRI